MNITTAAMASEVSPIKMTYAMYGRSPRTTQLQHLTERALRDAAHQHKPARSVPHPDTATRALHLLVGIGANLTAKPLDVSTRSTCGVSR